MLINLLIYGTIFFFSYKWIIERTGYLTGADTPDASPMQELINLFFLILGFLILLIVCYILFTTVGGLITAPFNERISRLVEETVTGQKIVDNITFWQDAWLSFKAEFLKLLLYFSIITPLFLINFVPMIGSVISTVLGTLFSFFYNALDFMDYPLTRRFYPLRKKIVITHAGGMLTYGFGCMAFLMTFLPVINVFFKPVLVVAGTAFFFEKEYDKLIK
jgi:CysZ protein